MPLGWTPCPIPQFYPSAGCRGRVLRCGRAALSLRRPVPRRRACALRSSCIRRCPSRNTACARFCPRLGRTRARGSDACAVLESGHEVEKRLEVPDFAGVRNARNVVERRLRRPCGKAFHVLRKLQMSVVARLALFRGKLVPAVGELVVFRPASKPDAPRRKVGENLFLLHSGGIARHSFQAVVPRHVFVELQIERRRDRDVFDRNAFPRRTLPDRRVSRGDLSAG